MQFKNILKLKLSWFYDKMWHAKWQQLPTVACNYFHCVHRVIITVLTAEDEDSAFILGALHDSGLSPQNNLYSNHCLNEFVATTPNNAKHQVTRPCRVHSCQHSSTPHSSTFPMWHWNYSTTLRRYSCHSVHHKSWPSGRRAASRKCASPMAMALWTGNNIFL